MTMDIGKPTSVPAVSAPKPPPRVTPKEVIKKEHSLHQKMKHNIENQQKVIKKLQNATTAQVEKQAEIKEILKELIHITESYNKRLDFEIKEGLDQVVVKVIDAGTGEVLKEFPPEEMQKLHLRIKEVVGLLFDEVI